MKNKRQFESLLYSVIGVVAMFLIVVAIYFIVGTFNARVDLTADNLYTLSPGTKRILEKLDTPVEIRFYATQDSKDMPVVLKNYAQHVEDLLQEYRKTAPGKITLKKLDPEPDTDAEDSASIDGVEGQAVNLGAKIYLGLAVSQLDQRVAIPFLTPEREKLLEYDISRAISQVSSSKKAVVGVMSALPVFGMPSNPMMMQMGQQGQEPWVFISELKRDFDVRQVEMNGEAIPADIKLMVLVHPKAITDEEQFALDQFILRGGKLIAFLDSLSFVDTRNSPGSNPLQAMASATGSNLPRLLKAWGLSFDSEKVLADSHYSTRMQRNGQVENTPVVLSLTPEAINEDDVVLGQIDDLLLPFAGVFSGTPAEGLTQTVLLHSSESSQLVDRFTAQFSGEQVNRDFKPSGTNYTLALRLTGKFKTAFPEGKPKATAGAADEKQEKPEASAAEAPLKESKGDGVVILVGDSDLLYDSFAVRQLFGRQLMVPMNANLSFLQNAVEQLSGDDDLIAVRSRAVKKRPFTVVRDMQEQAKERYRSKIQELQRSLSDAQSKLNQLQQQKEAGQRFILSPEQQAEIQKVQEKERVVKRELRDVEKSLARDIRSLETRLEWVNIAGMPLLVTLLGIGLAIFKRKRTAAK